jgi:hypothetical protein
MWLVIGATYLQLSQDVEIAARLNGRKKGSGGLGKNTSESARVGLMVIEDGVIEESEGA